MAHTPPFSIRRATADDDAARAALLAHVYQENADRLAAELAIIHEHYADGGALDPVMIAWVAVTDEGRVIAVLEAGMRLTANGCDTLRVLFIEGVAVTDDYRGTGVAAALLAAAENWARHRGITEVASDVELDNDGAQRWHKMMGFAETERVVCFRKVIA